MSGNRLSDGELTNEQYQTLIERTSDVITVVDADGTILYQSPRSSDVKGWPREELVGENILEYVHPEDRDRVLAKFSSLTEETGFIDDEVEFRFRKKDDEWVWLAVTGTAPDGDSAIDGYITTSRDITDRKRHERELKRYKQLVDNVPVGIYRRTPGEEGRFVEVNPAMVEIFDADSAEQLLDTGVRELYVDEGNLTDFAERLESERIVTEVEHELRTLSGDRFWASVTAIRSTVDGDTYYDGVLQNITRRKNYEQQIIEQRNDLEILNQVVRHDIRNDLQLIETYSEILEDHVTGERAEYLETIQESVESAVSLTMTARDLTEVMLRTDGDPQPTSLAHVLTGQIERIRTMYPNAVIDVDGSIPETRVLADELLDSVFSNLLENGIQHNDSDVPKLTVSVSEGADLLRVRIADNGPGVSDEQKDEIFGKGEKGLESAGTGLGLYLVKSLVESYGGDVWVEDNDPAGAVFVVEFLTPE